jgi:hypothetical protein
MMEMKLLNIRSYVVVALGIILWGSAQPSLSQTTDITTAATSDTDTGTDMDMTDNSSLMATPTNLTLTNIESDSEMDASAMRRSYELSSRESCHVWRKFVWMHSYWIVQFPPEWWKARYDGNEALACDAVRRNLQGHIWERFITDWECWEMERQYASGGVNWLHVRFVTGVLVCINEVDWMIEMVADPAGRAKVRIDSWCHRTDAIG